MMMNKIHEKAGSLSKYVWYIVIVFFLYFAENVYTSIQPVSPGSFIEGLLYWGFRMLIVPFILSGVYGGIHEQQKSEEVTFDNKFFTGVKKHYWRFAGANVIALILFYIITIVILLLGNLEANELENNLISFALTIVPLSALTLLWFGAIVVEKEIFLGLYRAVKTLIFNPYFLAIGLVWACIAFADTVVFNLKSEQLSLALNGIRAAVLAFVRILAVAYALAAYKIARSKLFDEESEELTNELSVSGTSAEPSGDGLVRASFGFSFFSFVPLLHLVALILGILAIKRKKRFVWRSAIACGFGGFFTIFYLLLISGWVVGMSTPSNTPSYEFIAQSNPNAQPYVLLLEQGAFQEIQQQIGEASPDNAGRHWTYDCVLALSKYQDYDLEGALADFYTALGKHPERGEFYFYYGTALLDYDQVDMAADQFQNALIYDPNLEIAGQYLTLANNVYSPSKITSSLMFIIILLLLFTLHEYGHAYAAWKLGDDTAKNQGRLTLNPISHLDLFGSILLPAILLLQQSDTIFGWAKPVPVNPENFEDPRKDHIRVSFSGPAINLLVAMLCFIILGCIMFFLRLLWPETLSYNLITPYSPVSLVGVPGAQSLVFAIIFIKQLFYTSLVLGFFNLIPIPPLDGSHILAGLLPQRFGSLLEKGRKFSYVIFLILVITPVFDYFLAIPIGVSWIAFQFFASAMGFG